MCGRPDDKIREIDKPFNDALTAFYNSADANRTTEFPPDPLFTQLWIKSGKQNAHYSDWIVRSTVSKIAARHLAGQTKIGKAFPVITAFILDEWIKAGEYDRFDIVAGTMKFFGQSPIALDVLKTINGTSVLLLQEKSIWDLVAQHWPFKSSSPPQP